MRGKYFLLGIMSIGITALLLAMSFISAETSQKNILFVLDSSASMQDPMGGKTKLDIAKETLSNLLDDLPQDANVGLIVYGNKVQRSCEIIDLMVPIKKLNIEAMKRAIQSVSARGKTPIATSLQTGAEELKKLDGDKALILISDGQETCGGDPIATADRIRQELGINVVIHVIGFDVDEATRRQLLGIAKAGGGSYYSADNAEELKKSLVKVKEEVIKKEEPPKIEPPKIEPPKELFSEGFDKSELSADWTIINEDKEAKIIDSGVCTIIPAVGEFGKETVKNILLYKEENLPENYDVILRYKTDIQGYYSNYSVWAAQMAGILLYEDKDNYLYLVSKARVGYNDKTQFWFVKVSKGEKAPDVMADIPCKNPDTFTIKIEKRKFKYTAFVEFQGEKGPEWKEVGTHTALGKKFYPGIAAFRMSDAKEVTAEFDYFKIDELK